MQQLKISRLTKDKKPSRSKKKSDGRSKNKDKEGKKKFHARPKVQVNPMDKIFDDSITMKS